MKNTIKELKLFIILWLTQSFSTLGSSMTGFALVIWVYNGSGSALKTALLTICSYAPYVVMSIFAGAISDKWNKKTVMLVCDSFAALCTVAVFVLLKSGNLQVQHLYILNALNGLMNTIQQPASDVAVTLLTPEKYYQKTSGMRSLSNSLVTILTPVFAAAVVAFAGIEAVIAFDLLTFSAAFLSLLFLIPLPQAAGGKAKELADGKKEDADEKQNGEEEAGGKPDGSLWQTARAGMDYLRANKGILWLMLFLAAINFVASVYEAALPAMILSKENEKVLGAVNTCVGIATLAGSVAATFLKAPKSRVRVICNCLLFSMCTENFMLAFGKTPALWCIGALLGWLFIPLMNANMDVVFRMAIPVKMQGRVYSVRNTLQFFTIPLGYFCGGLLVDRVFEPWMAAVPQNGILAALFGSGKGSGAAFLFFVAGIAGVAVCLIFRRVKYIREMW
ncbi:MAG: MFS transporter [Lachnospiraceae bacterium]|nr:MFS transporter [Lachnospiraceae bacterium]